VGELELLGRVGTIIRYPIKSMLGEPLDTATLTGAGVVGDRIFAVLDNVTNNIMTGKSLAGSALLQVQGEVSGENVWFCLPDGRRISCTDSDADDVLYRYLGHPVSLIATDSLRSFSTDSGFDLRVNTFVDSTAVHLLTTSSLQGLQIAGEQEDKEVLVRRFRPNFVIESDEDEYRQFPEHELVDKVLRVGETVRLYVRKRTLRCALPSRAQLNLPPNPELLKTLKGRTKNNLGVYAAVIDPGIVRKGDEVWVEDSDD
jgi:uncharacterized protein